MSEDPTTRVAEKLQAVYDGADAEERAVLDELGGVLRTVDELTAGEGDEVVGFGTGLEAVRARMWDPMKELDSQDKLGNFEIQDLMSDYNSGLSLSRTLARRWPPGL
jgi:hypothetical protein